MEVYHELIDNALLGLAIIQDKKLVYANKGLADIIGLTLEDMIALSSDNFMSMIHPDDRNRILGALIDGISSNKLPLRQEFRVIRKNGDIAWTDARANFIEFNGKRAMQVAFMDITSRKNAEIEANAAKEEYGEILSSISDGFLALDDNLLITYFNTAAESMLGRAASEVIGHNLFDAFPEYKGSVFEDTYIWAVKEKRHISFETYFGKNPYENWYDVRVYPRKNGISVYFQVITDRKAAEERLRQSEEQYRQFYETMLQGVVYQNPDGKITSANPAAERILGLSSDQMNGGTSADHGWKAIHEDGSDFPGEAHPSMIALSTGKAVENVIMGVFNPSDGDYRWININTIPQFMPGETEPYRVYTTLEDITERKKMEDQMLTMLQRFYSILSNMYASILLVSNEGRIEFANQAFCEFFNLKELPRELNGITAAEMIEKIKNSYLHSDEEVARIKEIIEQGKPVKGEEIAMSNGRTCLRDFIPIKINGKSYGRLWHHHDITDRKKAEEALSRNLALLASSQEIGHLGNWTLDFDAGKFEASNENYRIYGLAPGSPTILDDIWKLIHPDDLDRYRQYMEWVRQEGRLGGLDYRIVLPDGSVRYVHALTSNVVRDQNGRVKIASGITQDITERKQVEEELRKTLESIGDGFIALDANWRFIYLNASAEGILGFGRDEALNKIFWDVFPKTISTNLEREYHRAMAGEATIFESFYEPWGRWFLNRCHPREGGGISVYFEDITERKRMEEALNKSEKKFRSIVENSEAGISLIDDCGNIVEWNASQEYITGLKREDVIGRPAWDIKFQLIPQEQRTQEAYEKLKSFLLRLTDKGRKALKGWIDDQEIQSSDGRRKTIHEVIFPIRTDKGYNIGLITHDITERMETEKSLRITNAAIESALNAMSLASPSGDLFYANESWLKMMGYEREEIEGRSLKDFSQNPEDADEIAKQISATGRWECELVARKKDGSNMDVHLSASAVKDKLDRTICIISSFIDISVSKKAQRELEESKNKLKAIFDLVPVGIYVGDKNARIIEANPYFLDFMGLSLDELNQRKHWERRYFSPDGNVLPKPAGKSFSFFPAYKPFYEGKPSRNIEIGMEKENGEIVWASANAVPTPFSDWPVIVALLDITNRRKMEEDLRIKDAAIEGSIAATCITDLKGSLTYINPATLNMWGFEKEYALGKPAGFFWEDYRKFEEVIAALLKNGSWSGDIVGKKKDGSKFDFHLAASIIKDTAGRPICLHGSTLDITERKKMEKELREREERFRKVFELSPIGIQLFDAEGFLVSANQASQKINDKIETARHKRHNLFRDVLADVEGHHRLMSGQIVNVGRWVKAKSGKAARPDKDALSNRKEQIYVENVVTVLGEASDPDGYLCIQQDLTEHRLADEVMISENERLQIIYDIWKTRVKTSDMRLQNYQE